MSEPVIEAQEPATATPTSEAAPAPESDAPWYASMGLDESSTGYVQAKGWESPKALLDSYRNLEGFKGAPPEQLLKLPEEMLPENMGEIWNRLGRPETVDGYEVVAPEGVQIDKTRLDNMRRLAHEHGLTKDAFSKLAEMDMQYQAEQNRLFEENITNEWRSQEVELKNEWGSKYDESVFVAEKGMREMGITEEQKDILKHGLGYDGMIKLFHKVASAMGEKAFAEGEKRTDFGITPEMARYEMDQIMGEASSDSQVAAQFQNKSGPKYARYNQLLQLRHKEG